MGQVVQHAAWVFRTHLSDLPDTHTGNSRHQNTKKHINITPWCPQEPAAKVLLLHPSCKTKFPAGKHSPEVCTTTIRWPSLLPCSLLIYPVSIYKQSSSVILSILRAYFVWFRPGYNFYRTHLMKMNVNDFLTLPLAPTAGQSYHKSSEISQRQI